MRQPLFLALAVAVAVSGCARVTESRFNPLNWFGASQSAPANRDAAGNLRPLVVAGGVQEIDARVLIASVDAMEVLQTSTGAIVQAVGTASAQGRFNADLVPVRAEAGTLTLAFRVEPSADQGTGPAETRRVTAARVFTFGELAGVSRIAVQGRQNQRISAR